MVIERRQSDRIAVAWKATLTRLNGEQLSGSTDNLSLSGVNVILTRELVIGEPLSLQLVSRCSGSLCCFELQVAVVHIKRLPKNLGYSVGMRLIAENPKYKSAFTSLRVKSTDQRSA